MEVFQCLFHVIFNIIHLIYRLCAFICTHTFFMVLPAVLVNKFLGIHFQVPIARQVWYLQFEFVLYCACWRLFTISTFIKLWPAKFATLNCMFLNQLYQREETEILTIVPKTEEDKMKEYQAAAKRLDHGRLVGFHYMCFCMLIFEINRVVDNMCIKTTEKYLLASIFLVWIL